MPSGASIAVARRVKGNAAGRQASIVGAKQAIQEITIAALESLMRLVGRGRWRCRGYQIVRVLRMTAEPLLNKQACLIMIRPFGHDLANRLGLFLGFWVKLQQRGENLRVKPIHRRSRWCFYVEEALDGRWICRLELERDESAFSIRNVGCDGERRLIGRCERKLRDHVIDRAQMPHLANGDPADFRERRRDVVAQ
jgi:hypothetical protein